jgi:hypothetical protein
LPIAAIGAACAMQLLLPSSVAAQPRRGFDGKVIVSPPHKAIACSEGTYLVGVTETQTDRIVGVAYDCVGATRTQQWDTENYGHRIGFGDIRKGKTTNKSCPKDYFIVGLNGTHGSYKAETRGMAAVGMELLADIAPVCRNGQNVLFELKRSYLDQADDNSLSDVAWDGLGGARSCRAGYAAVSISFLYDGRRDIDPDNRFIDAALTCRRLPLNPAGAASTTRP